MKKLLDLLSWMLSVVGAVVLGAVIWDLYREVDSIDEAGLHLTREHVDHLRDHHDWERRLRVLEEGHSIGTVEQPALPGINPVEP